MRPIGWRAAIFVLIFGFAGAEARAQPIRSRFAERFLEAWPADFQTREDNYAIGAGSPPRAALRGGTISKSGFSAARCLTRVMNVEQERGNVRSRR